MTAVRIHISIIELFGRRVLFAHTSMLKTNKYVLVHIGMKKPSVSHASEKSMVIFVRDTEPKPRERNIFF